MGWRKETLDFVLVPLGLLLLIGYHIFFVYRCIRLPQTTTIGYESHYCRVWVQKIIQVNVSSRSNAFTVIGSNISAATFMATTSLALSSVIGTWIGSSSSSSQAVLKFVYGDTRTSTSALKYITVLAFFLLAFASFIQCARSFVRANFLISMPEAVVPVDIVEEAVINGHLCWQVGLRAVYFAVTLLLWVFGPIPMFIGALGTVFLMRCFDWNKKPLHEFPKPVEKKVGFIEKMGEEVEHL